MERRDREEWRGSGRVGGQCDHVQVRLGLGGLKCCVLGLSGRCAQNAVKGGSVAEGGVRNVT